MQTRAKRAASSNGSAADASANAAGTKKLKSNTADESQQLTVNSIHRAVTAALTSTSKAAPSGLLIPPLCRVVAEYAAPFVVTRTEYRPATSGDKRMYGVVFASDSGECVIAISGQSSYALSLRSGTYVGGSEASGNARHAVGTDGVCLVVVPIRIGSRRRVCGISFLRFRK